MLNYFCATSVVSLLAAFGFGSLALAQNIVNLGIPENLPFTGLTEGRATGLIGEAATISLQSMGYEVKCRHVPFARLYKWVHSGRMDAGASLFKTPERQSLAHYSAPIVTEYTIIAVPKGKAFPLDQINDLTGKLIGGILGFNYPTLDKLNFPLVRERSYLANLKKIGVGRIDGILIGSITGRYLAQINGFSDKMEFLPNAVGKVGLGVAVS